VEPPVVTSAVRGLFITGTGTGVGKTEVAAALARLLANSGVAVRVRKPVESGCLVADGVLVPADAMRLREAARCRDPLDVVCPYRLRTAISPERAAALESVELDLARLERACRHDLGPNDFVLVEGAGGLLSPLARDGLGADLAVRLALPVLLVVADRLGCINHTLLSVEALAARGLVLAAVVLNRMDAAGAAEMNNAADLAKWLGRPVVCVPRSAPCGAPWAAMLPHLTALARQLRPVPASEHTA
jgi:dethiobiotin synthetase